MKQKILWCLGFVVSAAISCWATSSSFLLMMPSLFSSNVVVRTIMVWLMVLLIYVLASFAMKWVVDSLNNDGYMSHPKAKLWGGLATLFIAWLILSFPTNAHTFFYKLKIGDVLTEDLSTTQKYSQQLVDRTVVDPDYNVLEKKVLAEWKKFEDEVKSGTTGSGIGEYAASHVSEINNNILPAGYQIPMPTNTNRASDLQNTNMLNTWRENYLNPTLERLKSDRYLVEPQLSNAARKDVKDIKKMDKAIRSKVQTNQISEEASEPLILQADGVLKSAYSHINAGQKYVKFDNEKDKKRYTVGNDENKVSRFMNPYSVLYDFATGKIPVTFIFWLILSLVIDLAGFFFYYQWTKKEFKY